MVGLCIWGASRAFQDPVVSLVSSTPDHAASAQQKLFRLLRGAARDPVILSEAEVNAFISRNVDPRDLPLDHPTVFLRPDDVVELVGQVSIARLLGESPAAILGAVLPSDWLTRRLWLEVAAHAEFEHEPRTQLRLAIRRVTLGRQSLPTVALRVLFEPASLRFVRVPLPATVAGVRIESGRAVIQPTSSHRRI